ncbi:WD repeat-containing protein 26-like isoform X2 [Ananas comosus]|uniref:WD repeat-containing protein 26-like isoform X1 n=1 Tax=Ananas comosus TaxID=4615 RepID=A0A6P5G1B2_ANACO|nr:WD repeat-containing protein 26-like isoform X1 [Ananas comosus]XP_020099485.1 WD repeat-containing protein 26-like isoform X2 [Ananas comosus]
MERNLDEPPAKRIKPSSPELGKFSDNSSPPHHSNPSDKPMSEPSSSRGQIHGDMVGSKGLINRVEFVRVITKTLYTLGYKNAGASLEQESGIQLHSDSVNLFREQVLSRNWDGSLAALHILGISDGDIVRSASFLILEQKFLQLLRNGKATDALEVLRREITPLGINTKRIHELCSYMIGFGKIGGESPSSPMKVLEELQKLLPPYLMVAEKRLEHLIEEALTMQKNACPFHNPLDSSLSLYADHRCRKDQIPSQTTQVLEGHTDEVWFVRFSNSGRYLASSSSDKSAIIWEVNEDGKLWLKHTLCGHLKPVVTASWNPDDTQLLTCGWEEDIRRWDVESGECIGSYQRETIGFISYGFGFISCGFISDGKMFFSCLNGMDFCISGFNWERLKRLKGQRNTNFSDMAVTKDNNIIIFTDKNSALQLLDVALQKKRFVEEEHTITSFSLSKDEDFLLVDLVNQEIHLWSIKDEPKLVMRFNGHKRTQLLIRSCFGGLEQGFVASGSEDSRVYIWHRGTGTLLEALDGHSGAVNCVSWNPANPHMLASASDDWTIRVWGTKTC